MYIHCNCPICKNADTKHFLACKDHTVSKETFNIVECVSCGFKYTNPIPDHQALGKYYKSDEYISHSNTRKGLISQLYHIVRTYTLKKKVAFVSGRVSRGTLLDYGCGTGMFLKACKDRSWKTYGIEPDYGARTFASDLGLKVFENKSKLLNEFGNTKFDAITLWHVLEHVTDIDDTLSFFNKGLNKNGILCIAVPNHQSHDAKYYMEHWAAYDVPRHLYHFDKKSIQNMLAKFDFELVEIKPMKFDSFYVSMLSEKYKTGSINYIRAFIEGLMSNMKASASKEYSSLIYVFKRK